MTNKKPIGYTKEQTKSMRALIERTEPKSGDYVGSGTVTTTKKKKMKRMQMGGMAMPVRGGGGVPVQGPGGVIIRPKPPMRKPGMSGGRPGFMSKGPGMPAIIPDRRGMKGGGLARKGVGMALAAGGIVKAPARSYKDMRAGAGSGVGRIQKTKIAGRGR